MPSWPFSARPSPTNGKAIEVAQAKQPDWVAFPQAAKIRILLFKDDIKSAKEYAGDTLYEPISIPYARYTIFLCLANIELAVCTGDQDLALTLVEDLLDEVNTLTRVGLPDILRWKGKAQFALGKLDKAHQTLTQACSQAQSLGASSQLWPIFENLALANDKLGRKAEAEEN